MKEEERFRRYPEETKTVDGEHSYPIYFDWVLIALRRCEHPDSYESQFSQIATQRINYIVIHCPNNPDFLKAITNAAV